MKVLFDHQLPFLLAHGGFEIQIEQTKKALEQSGIEVEWLRWWDPKQTGDLIHFFGRAESSHIEFAHGRGIKYVMGELLTGQGSRSVPQLKLQRLITKVVQRFVPHPFKSSFRWDSYQMADGLIALTPWEAEIMQILFAAQPDRIHVVPNGVEEIFFSDPTSNIQNPKSPFLVCTATITERKRVVELAEAAVVAGVPVWILGKPYFENDPYYLRFLTLHHAHPELIKYEGAINDRSLLAEIYKAARGFVLLSTMESLSLSALEATAAGCPLLLSDLPWARCTFGDDASYTDVNLNAVRTGRALKAFHDSAPSLPIPRHPKTWTQVAEKISSIYETILNS